MISPVNEVRADSMAALVGGAMGADWWPPGWSFEVALWNMLISPSGSPVVEV